MKPRKVQPIIDDLIGCFCLLSIGLAAPFVPDELDNLALLLCLFLVLAGISVWLWRGRLSEADKREMKRDETDERSLMVLERATWLSSEMEHWLLIGLFFLFSLPLSRPDIAYVFYWIIIARRFLLVAARWWMNRKY